MNKETEEKKREKRHKREREREMCHCQHPYGSVEMATHDMDKKRKYERRRWAESVANKAAADPHQMTHGIHTRFKWQINGFIDGKNMVEMAEMREMRKMGVMKEIVAKWQKMAELAEM